MMDGPMAKEIMGHQNLSIGKMISQKKDLDCLHRQINKVTKEIQFTTRLKEKIYAYQGKHSNIKKRYKTSKCPSSVVDSIFKIFR